MTLTIFVLAAIAIRTARSQTTAYPTASPAPTASTASPSFVTSAPTELPTVMSPAPTASTASPSFVTSAPTETVTVLVSTMSLEADGACFTDGCAVTKSFNLTDGLEELVAASLSVGWKGDIGESWEIADLYVNDIERLRCDPTPSRVEDCPPDFQTCATGVDVLAELTSGDPLVVMLDSGVFVGPFCDDAHHIDYAIRARFVLTFECTTARATATGCLGTAEPTTSPAPTSPPTPAPTTLPSLVPTSAPSPSPTSKAPTFTPFPTRGGDVVFPWFRTSPCDHPMWWCTLPSAVDLGPDDTLLVEGHANYIGLTGESFPSTEMVAEYTITKSDVCDDHVIVFSTSRVTFSWWWDGVPPRAIQFMWVCNTLVIEGPRTFGPSTSASTPCATFDKYDVVVEIGALSASITAVGITSGVTCSVFLPQGFEAVALSGENVYFTFGADADHLSGGAVWHSLIVNPRITDPTPMPTSVSPTVTPLPTVSGYVAFPFFETNPCDDPMWTCSVPLGVAVGANDTLLLTGHENYITRTGESFHSTRTITGNFRITRDHRCDSHFIYFSTSSTTAWIWGSTPGTIAFAWICDELSIFGPLHWNWNPCPKFDTYDVDFSIDAFGASITAVGVNSGVTCSVNLFGRNGLTTVAPSGENVYFTFGADSGAGEAVWHSLFMNVGSLFLPSAVPTAPPTFTPTSTFAPTKSGDVRFPWFRESPCPDPMWTCSSPLDVGVGDGDTLRLWGVNNYITRNGESFPSTGGIEGQYRITKDDSCNNHFVYFSTSSTTGWAVGSAFGTIKLVWNCNNLFIYGPSTSASTSCATYDTYDVTFDIGGSNATLSAVGVNSGDVCSVVLSQGFEAVAPSGEDVYFTFGADTESSFWYGYAFYPALWHSLFVNVGSVSPTSAPTTLAPASGTP